MNLLEQSDRKDYHRKQDNYALGTPDGYELDSGDVDERPRLKLDDVIEEAISKLPMAARLYPEVYVWRVSEAVISHLEG